MISACLLLSACTVPVDTKNEARTKAATEFKKNANYLYLAHYWDEHATKQTIDFKSATYLAIWEKEKKAEITIGNGPYYGMIELTAIDENNTSIKTYAWGGMTGKISEWKKLIMNAPDENNSK